MPKKTLKDKRRQNFRIVAEKYTLGEDNNLYLKLANDDNKNELYKIPYEGEVIALYEKFHDNNGHLQYKRLYNEIKGAKYIWKTMKNGCLNYVKNCPICIRNKGGKNIKPLPTTIIPKGPRERYVMDGWKLHNSLAEKIGFTWIVDLIDHFSKFMMSFPVEKNDSVHTVNCLHEFCALVGYPRILQSDNGSEYKNHLMEEFCIEHNIKHIF